MNNPIQDQAERERALDPTSSFIVQAPAGSGKTELLTQRFLVLLSRVKQPEEILAITFTKKSAAEMRARIIHSLKNGLNIDEPSSDHAKKTWALAKRVLQQNEKLKWDLLNNPNRLRVQTIDSFNSYLTRQLPILSNFGATPEIAANPKPLYRAAVREFLSHLEENVSWSDAIAQLLRHLDNDLDKVENLLITMLAKRDQWLPYITTNSNSTDLRKKLEAPLFAINRDVLKKLNRVFPAEHREELLFLSRFAMKTDFIQLPTNKKDWLTLSRLLFTNDLEFRKRVDKSIGFPGQDSTKNPAEKIVLKETKQRMEALLDQLRDNDELKAALKELNKAPDPFYTEKQWETLNALHEVLQISVAQLKCVFQQHNQIDFIENAEAAQRALGTLESPTDLTLALDYQIAHILIDEFQDTSNSQYRLLEKLTAGWEENDGRTLFVVGDPMQSIYRFREAEVGLYIRARHHGIGHIKLQPLTLSVNFRSSKPVVDWINHHFKRVLPSFEDVVTGAVSYSPCVAKESEETGGVTLYPFSEEDSSEQTNAIINLIQKKREENPCETIAILVRARTHLESIIPALKKAGLSYRALDIDPLNERPVIQDLIALTCALSHPADRIAWLSILRAPWCGLLLSDLHVLSSGYPHTSILERLLSPHDLKKLSDDGQARVTRIIPILKNKIADRGRYHLRLWIETTWLELGGPACVLDASDLDDAASFFTLLEKLENGSGALNLDELMEQVSQLFASPNNNADDSLQIMTLHNAKGLEFDTVILPHLEKKSPNDSKQLLLWTERPNEDDTSSLLLAPINATDDENDLIYNFIKNQHGIKTDYELGRLLYVAVTRAKKEAHLFFNLKTKEEREASEKSLLEKLWPSIKNECAPSSPYSELKEKVIESKQEKQIQRLSLNWKNPFEQISSTFSSGYHQKSSGFQLKDTTPKHVGTLTHQILQQLAKSGILFWETKSEHQKEHYIKKHLTRLGVTSSQLPDAFKTVLKAIQQTISDPRGQWILKPHSEAETEFHLTANINNKIHAFIIDRTFVDEKGVRWIIDYKTSVEVAKEKHEEQMQHYLDAMQLIDSRPIRLGLYFPLVPAWVEW